MTGAKVLRNEQIKQIIRNNVVKGARNTMKLFIFITILNIKLGSYLFFFYLCGLISN